MPTRLALLLLLGGCSSFELAAPTRVVCTVAGDKAYTVTPFLSLGLAGVVAEEDRAVLCSAPVVEEPKPAPAPPPVKAPAPSSPLSAPI